MKKGRILIAHDANHLGVVTKALEGYDLVVVSDVMGAQYQIMEDGIDLVIIGIHFDESRAIELVNIIRSDDKHKKTPIVLIRLSPTGLSESINVTTAALIKIGTVSEYLELESDPEAALKIKDVVGSLLPGEKVLA